MPTIKVDFGKLSQLESQLSRVPSVISSAASSVSSVRSGLDWDVACEASIDRKLRDIANALNDSKSRMQKTAQFVGNAVQQYQKAENGVDQRYQIKSSNISGFNRTGTKSSSAVLNSLLLSYKKLNTGGFTEGIKRSDAEISEDMRKAIGRMYGYPDTQSSWTTTMKRKVEQFISSGTVTEISEGIYCISNGDKVVYLNAGGELLRTEEYKESATNLEITEKIYHPDGSFEEHTRKGGITNIKASSDEEELSVKLSKIEIYNEENTSIARRYERFVEDVDSLSKITVDLLKYQNGSSWNASLFKFNTDGDSFIEFSPEFGGGIDFHADIVDMQISEGQSFGDTIGTEVTATVQAGSLDAEVMPIKVSNEEEGIKVKSSLDLKFDLARIPLETEIKTIKGSGFLEGINIKFAPEVSYGIGATLSSELSSQGVWKGKISAALGQGAGASITIDASEYIDNTVENISNTFKKLHDFGSKLNSLRQNSQQAPFIDYKVLAM